MSIKTCGTSGWRSEPVGSSNQYAEGSMQKAVGSRQEKLSLLTAFCPLLALSRLSGSCGDIFLSDSS